MHGRGQPTALLVGILLHGLDALPAGIVKPQLCHLDAGYVSDCLSDPHCWRLGPQDGVQSAADCQRRCAEFSGCTYFTLHRTFGLHCDLLGPDAKFSPKMPRAISGDTSCKIIEEPLGCHVSAGYAYAFANETGFTTLEACKGACDMSTSCSIFSFNQYLKTCHFLDGNATYYPWLIGVVSGRRGCELPPSQLACKTDFAFTEPGAMPLPLDRGVDNADACQRECLKASRCKYFTFNVIYGRCWLMGGNATLLPLEGTISGKEDCNMSNICSYRRGSYGYGEAVPLPLNLVQGALTARECRDACREEEACEYFSYQLDGHTCELTGKGALLIPGPYYVSGDQDCELPAEVDKFCLEDAGAYIDALRGLSAPNGPEDGDPFSCQQACKNMSNCNFFTFSNASRQCWLMEKAYLSGGLLGYWSGQQNCRLPDPGACEVDKGYAHPGAALPNFGATSPTICLEACKRDPACRFFTFNVLTRSCWLLGQDAVFMTALPGVISGPPDCVQTARTSKALVGFQTFMQIFFPQVSSLLRDQMKKVLATDCPEGQANFWGQGTCSECPNGSTRRRGGATRCIPCGSGTYNPGQQDDCDDNDFLIVKSAIRGNMPLVVILRDFGTDMQLAQRTAAWHNHTGAVRVLVKAAGTDGMKTFKAAVENATACSLDPAKECHREFAVMEALWHANKDVGSTEGSDLQAIVKDAVHNESVKVVQRMAAYDLIPTQHSDSTDDMPIFFAAEMGNQPLSQVLLDAGESVEWKSKEGLTPIDEAMLEGHDDLADFLELHARDLKQALADPKTHICVGLSFALSVAFWLAQVCCSSSRRRSSAAGEDGSGSSSDEGVSSAASRLSEEDGYLGKAVGGEGKASRGAVVLAAKACSPASKQTMATIMRFLGVLANFVFPGTFCARYVANEVWLAIIVLLYLLPATATHGCKTICDKPALVLSFSDFNWLGMHRHERNASWHSLFALLRAVLILPLAICLGGPKFHQEYAFAAEHAPFMIGAWYSFCQWLELHVPSICGLLKLENTAINASTDLISFQHWYPANRVHPFPLKLCPKLLSHCIFKTGFDMYLAIISLFAVLGFVTCLWCFLTLALLCNSHMRHQSLSKDIQASVHKLALEIEQLDSASEVAELGPESEDLPKEVREVMRSNVKPVSALSVYAGDVFMLLDVALDVNTILTMLISSHFFAASVLMWFFFVSLMFELWDGSIYHLRADSAEAIRRGYPVERQLNVQDRERGFEAFGSLIVMTASLLYAIKTPWQFLSGTLSLLSSTSGIASYVFELVELPHEAVQAAGEESEEGTDYTSD